MARVCAATLGLLRRREGRLQYFLQRGHPCAAAHRAGGLSGDFLDRTPLYRQLRAHWSAYAGGAAGPVEHLDLPAAGRAGNSHMPMTDTDSDVVAAMIAQWFGASAPA
ncbi:MULTISPECIES: hypothetical protein [Pseudonocardia]|uniref:hypothetical protein n=1 Tax=Pseudonocardia TaxID=1847 RepID=UPI000919FC35|nr:hypothetical protein [Pseudonocardia sp. SID8383]MYW76044.1 hypothetical protein [Pseudonocardia sp. SID8383]OJG07342.1 hypothetical protein BG618_01289 [Pseudonocardia autotrophica]